MNTMRKFYIALLLFYVLTVFFRTQPSHASDTANELELDVSKRELRFFEVGIKADANIANSYFTLGDVLEKKTTPDYNKILGFVKQGLEAGLDFDLDFFMNLNFDAVQLGFFTNFHMDTVTLFDSNVFEFLAKAVDGNTFFVDIKIGGSVFMDTGIHLDTHIGKLCIKLSPAYYIPLIFIPYTSASFIASYDAEGNIKANGTSVLNVYSVFPLDEISSFDNFLETISLSDLLRQGGLDISVEAIYSLFPVLDLGLSLTHIPIAPATMDSTFAYSAFLDFSMESILAQLINEGRLDTSGIDYGLNETSGTLTLIRPIKLSLFADWNVFDSDILILSPKVELRFADTASQRDFGAGYRVKVESHIGFLNPSFTTSYTEEIFIQELGISLNFRVIDIDLVISTQSQNFLKSFQGAGIGAGIGITIGY